MPFALVFIGLLLIVTGAKDTYREFGSELIADFTGEGNFTWWIASVGAVGAIGYVPELKTFSRWFLALIIVAMLIANRGVFVQLTGALQSGPVKPSSTSPTQNAVPSAPTIPASYDNPVAPGDTPIAHFATVVNIFKDILPFLGG